MDRFLITSVTVKNLLNVQLKHSEQNNSDEGIKYDALTPSLYAFKSLTIRTTKIISRNIIL